MSGDMTIHGNRAAFTPGTVDFAATLELAKASMKDAARLLSVSFLGAQTIEVPGNTKLEAPKKLSMDANLLLAQLQDTLNQLMQKVSVNDIKQNLQTQNDANKKQLDDMKEAAAARAAEKAKQAEAAKKSNVFTAISNWVQAAITAVSIAFTALAAVGQFLTGNMVAAAALFVAAAAMTVQLAGQVLLAIDATMAACSADGKGFLSDKAKEIIQKTVEIAGYVALAASMIGMIGGLVSAASTAGKQAASQIAQKGTVEVAKEVGETAVKEGAEEVAKGVTKEVTKEVAEEAAKKAADDALKQLTKEIYAQLKAPMMLFIKRMGATAALGGLAYASVKVAGAEITSDLKKEASDLQKEADLKLADVEATKAMIAKLQAMLDQLQEALDDQMEKGEDLMQALLSPITDRMKTMQTLVENLGA